ncbi:hypothetical protein SAMN05192569_102930 [Parageobacillus thermantarcticus]|uniref:Lipoprotein n=1 Tax=Parageobacillus thermantarcticus TaxID=186116 RepID=A0A1I0THN8_9BACL|nr:hypothetical protein [Parageobacillus thermantarcticus]SFA51255.1 hypothetical protein SAMN05192569_102930 [Parageobacillus thermantarcticus]
MKNFKRISLFSFFLVCIISACTNLNESNSYSFTIKDHELIDDSLEELLVSSIQKVDKEASKIEKVEIEEINKDSDLVIATFLMNKGKEKYHGVFIANEIGKQKYEFVDIEYTKISSEKLSVFHYIGTKPGNISQRIFISSGFINDKNIANIYINYSDKKTSAIILNKDQKTFTEVRIGGEAKVDSIIGLSSSNAVIYEKNMK